MANMTFPRFSCAGIESEGRVFRLGKAPSEEYSKPHRDLVENTKYLLSGDRQGSFPAWQIQPLQTAYFIRL